MKKIIIILLAVIVLLAVIIFILRSPEDDWIRDSRGVWIKHGSPSETPDYVLEQQEVINCAIDLYGNAALSSEIQLDSQCLGTCGDYAVDIVHVPRAEEDNLVENQCGEYRDGKVNHFIEINHEGEIVRIV